MSTHQHHQGVKQAEGVCCGAVDGRHNGHTICHQALHNSHDLVGGEAVQATGRLVQEQHTWVGDEGDANVGALGLTSTDALLQRVADLDMPARQMPPTGLSVPVETQKSCCCKHVHMRIYGT